MEIFQKFFGNFPEKLENSKIIRFLHFFIINLKVFRQLKNAKSKSQL